MSGTILNVFRQDAFTSVTLTEAVARNPFLPQGLGALKVFEDKPIRTRAAAVEFRDGRLQVIATSGRGAPPQERITEKRSAIYFDVPRLATGDTVYASEVMDVREFGTENVLETVQSEVAYRLNGPTGLQKNIEFTWEAHRLGAVQGVLLDADGSTIYNWFTAFNVAPPAPVAFALASSGAGELRTACNQLVRTMSRAAKGAFTSQTRVIGLCGDEFWDLLVNHADVTSTYVNWAQAVELRLGTAFAGDADANLAAGRASVVAPMVFGGIFWVNYRGSDDLKQIAIGPTEAKFFPLNAPGVFKRFLAPHASAQWIGKMGRPMYVVPIEDKDRQEWWRMEVYSYPLHICTRPEVLMSGTA